MEPALSSAAATRKRWLPVRIELRASLVVCRAPAIPQGLYQCHNLTLLVGIDDFNALQAVSAVANDDLVRRVNKVIESIHRYFQDIVLTIIRDAYQREAAS